MRAAAACSSSPAAAATAAADSRPPAICSSLVRTSAWFSPPGRNDWRRPRAGNTRSSLRLGVPSSIEERAAELLVDALLGYGQQGPPLDEIARLIEEATSAPVLALDVPSGLELETGRLYEPHIRAAATLTLALPKDGLRAGDAPAVVGDLYSGDIAVPSAVDERLGLSFDSPFGRSPVVKVRAPALRACY
jgi:hypothetical protein